MNIQAPLALDVTTEAPVTAEQGQAVLPSRASIMRRLVRDKAAALAASFLTLVVLAAIFAPIVAPYDPYFTDLSKAMQAPSAAHWFGTDTAGRDVLSRVIYGSRNTLAIGLIGVIVGGVFGGLLGILAAYFRRLDGWIMRIVDIMLAFPAILLGLAVAAIFGAGLTAVIIAVVVA
jgi:ABC-type dipeptide/oligopeptide/nickel transport system permease subunit